MQKNLIFLFKGVFAGILISIGGIAYLAIENKFLGSFIFSIGLLTVCMYNMNLYTGKIGYILVNKPNYIIELLISLLGNILGTLIIGYSFRLTRFSNYITKAGELSLIKINDNYTSVFILSILCGIMMYIAVNNYKNQKDVIGKYLTIFLCVMTFILCGFEHCIANSFYFSISNLWSTKAILYLLIMIIGNSIGSIIIALYNNKLSK